MMIFRGVTAFENSTMIVCKVIRQVHTITRLLFGILITLFSNVYKVSMIYLIQEWMPPPLISFGVTSL